VLSNPGPPLTPRIIICHELFFMLRIIFGKKYKK
jgi:hypothetical protein